MAKRMPALFIGHGNPMNALLVNSYTQRWAVIGATLPKPKAILSVSAHWNAAVTVRTAPRTIHDFGGFPRELNQVQSPAPGDPDLAARVHKLLAPVPVRRDDERVEYEGIPYSQRGGIRNDRVGVKNLCVARHAPVLVTNGTAAVLTRGLGTVTIAVKPRGWSLVRHKLTGNANLIYT